jgi:hypothetical protein
MSVPSANAAATPTGDRPRPTFIAMLSRALRLAVMLVIVAAGLMLLQTYRAMLHDAPADSENNVPAKAAVFERGRDSRMDMEKMADDFLRPGAWSLGESNWSLALVDLSSGGDEARLQSLGSSPTDRAKPSDLEKKLLVWLRQVRPVVANNCRVYNVMARSVRVRAVTEKRGGDERVRLVQLLWKRGGAARLMEVSPTAASGAHERGDGHLLPLPNGSASMARRWDASGRLSCEILGPASAKECLREWSAAGWTTEKIGEAEGPISRAMLRKDDRVIQLFPIEAGPSGSPAYLLLMVQSAEQ